MYFLSFVTRPQKQYTNVCVLPISPTLSNMLSSIQCTATVRFFVQRPPSSKPHPYLLGRGGNSVALCGPVCIYEWMSLGAKPQEQCCYTEGLILMWEGWWWWQRRCRGGQLIPLCWGLVQRVARGLAGNRAGVTSVRGKAAGSAQTGAAERLEVGHGHGHRHRWADAVNSGLLRCCCCCFYAFGGFWNWRCFSLEKKEVEDKCS